MLPFLIFAYLAAGLLLALFARGERIIEGLSAFLTRPVLRHGAQLREVAHDVGVGLLILLGWPVYLVLRGVLRREARAAGNRP